MRAWQTFPRWGSGVHSGVLILASVFIMSACAATGSPSLGAPAASIGSSASGSPTPSITTAALPLVPSLTPTSTSAPTLTPAPTAPVYGFLHVSVVCPGRSFGIGVAKLTVTYTGTPSPSKSVLVITDPNWRTELAAGKPFGAPVIAFGRSVYSSDPHTAITALTDPPGYPKGIWVAWQPVRLRDPRIVHAAVPVC